MTARQSDAGSTNLLLLVGKREEFGPGFVGLVVGEFAPDRVVQRETLPDRPGEIADELSPGTITFLDIRLLNPATDFTARLAALTDDSRLVLCYRDTRDAAAILGAVLTSGHLDRISFLPRTIGLDLMTAALRLIALGGVHYPSEIVGAATPAGARNMDRSAHSLTDRELEVLDLVARGLTNKALARQLQVTEHTIKLHISNVIKKLDVPNRTAAVRWYLSN